jgi:hypothetical protein
MHTRTKLPAPLAADVAALIKNGMDFLDKAREEFEAKQYKHSVVSFWTAVEILLKVPLASEHWTLVCSGKKVSRKNYLAGDFQSVSFDDVCIRLRDILEKPLPKETEAVFNTIRNHRNRVVHFFHTAFSDSEVETILAEQARAWFALNRLMREDWQQHFASPHNRALALGETQLLRGNEFYAEARLKHIQPELEQLAAKGTEIHPCTICHQPAAIKEILAVGKNGPTVYEQTCYVCFHTERHVKFTCPECDADQVLPVEEEDGDTFTCRACSAELSRYNLLDDENFRHVDEMMYADGLANCAHCDGHETVCVFGENFLCTRCLEIHTGYDTCEICGTPCEAMGEKIRYAGCPHCADED